MNEKPEMDTPRKRPLGMDKGKVFVADNFDDLMPDCTSPRSTNHG